MSDEDDPAIIARCECGCGGVVYVNGMLPLSKRDQADIGKMVSNGLQIERVTVGYVRERLAGNWRCVSKRDPAQADRSPAGQDGATRLDRNDESAVGKADAP